MSRYCLDTSAYSRFQRGEARVVELIDRAEWIGMPAIALGELRVGFLLGSRREENEETLRAFLANPSVEELGVDHEVSRHYA
ncbi:MAG: PIN domain-containing protein, partial [Gemmatimonadota bacterium]